MSSYKFEIRDPSFGAFSDIQSDLDEFIRRLKNTPGDSFSISTNDNELLSDYVVANHRAADWYSKARDKKRKSRERYAWSRIILLILLPIFVLVLSTKLDSNAAATQATVILTGLMAAFRASSQWMETKFAASNFTIAASELKEGIYAFEIKWRGIAFVKQSLSDDCKKALKEGISKARKVVSTQRDAYFVASTPPSISIMQTLDKAKGDVAALFKNYQSPQYLDVLKAEQNEKAKQIAKDATLGEISKLTALINARDQLIGAKQKELLATSDDNRKTALQAFIAALEKSQEETEKALIQKSSSLSAI